MSVQKNPNIGHMSCPLCRGMVAIRKNKAAKFYYDCLECGRITPNHAGGQKYIMENATIWGAEGAPVGVPAWIREQWNYGKAIREGRAIDKVAIDKVAIDKVAIDKVAIDKVAIDKPAASPAAFPRLPTPPKKKPQAETTEEQPTATEGGFAFLEW